MSPERLSGLADGVVFLPFQRAVGNSFLIQDAVLKLSLLAQLKLHHEFVLSQHHSRFDCGRSSGCREGLSAILRSEKDIKIVAEAADGEEACKLYDRHSPDVVLLDLRMPKKDGLQVVTELMSSRRPKPRIIVMTTYETEEDVRRALRAGAKSYLVKGALSEQILETVRKVAEGEASVSPKIASKLTNSLGRPQLSARELEVLHHIAAGSGNKEIGQKLFITEHTVKAHVKSILAKLNAMGRTEAIAIATKRGLIPGS